MAEVDERSTVTGLLDQAREMLVIAGEQGWTREQSDHCVAVADAYTRLARLLGNYPHTATDVTEASMLLAQARAHHPRVGGQRALARAHSRASIAAAAGQEALRADQTTRTAS
ncbi:MAG: hypothetical protein ACRDR6_10835 [Pseudonocardiaceae bacterium]